MPALWGLILLLILPVAGYMGGYAVRQEQQEQNVTACPSPQHLGDITKATLVKRKGILTLECERHSTLQSEESPNRGEKK